MFCVCLAGVAQFEDVFDGTNTFKMYLQVCVQSIVTKHKGLQTCEMNHLQ